MNTVKYVKSFSKGQITIPKDFRDLFGLVNDFWLKLSLVDGKIIVEPIKEKDKTSYTKSLLAIKGNWINADELKENRHQVEQQLLKRAL